MRRLILLAVLALVAAACSSAESAPTTTTSTAPAGSVTTSSTTSTAAPAPSTTAANAEAPGGSLADCIVGAWDLDAERFFEMISEVMADEEVAGSFSNVGGVNRLTANADGTFVDERIDWTFAVESDFGSMEMTVNATQRGEWVVDGDVITTTVTEATDPSYSMAIDGVAFEFPGGAIPFEPPEVELNSGSAVCTGDTLALTVDGFVSHWMRTG